MWPWPEHNKQPIRIQTSHHCQAFGPSHLPGSTQSTWRDKKGKTVRDGIRRPVWRELQASAPLIDFVELSSASRCTWMWTSGYTGTLIYSLVLCQHPAVTEPSLLNINNSWLTLILCNSTIVSGQGSIKFSSLSSFQRDGVLNISCYRPPGQVGVWLDERSRRTACRCPRRRTGPPPGDVVKIHCGCRFLVMSPVEVVFFSIVEQLSLFFYFLFSFVFFLFFFFSLSCCFFLSLRFSPCFLLKRQPSQYGGQRGEDQGEAPGVGWSGGSVAAATEFKQTPTEIQVAGLLFQFLPEVRRSLLTVRQRRRGTGVEVIPVAGGRKHSKR